MANVTRSPSESDTAPVESARAAGEQITPSQPGPALENADPDSVVADFGELSPEAARSSPLDDIAEAEREQAPRD